ncbi:MAG: carbohydrate kinase family protein, partial [Clostridia bacterium]|nr:carbohydrate kinase family protein [Clostridia bacterium]
MKKTVVVAGTILADVVKVVESYPEKGMLAPISSITQAVGGCVPNTGIDLKKIDPELTVKAAGCVGPDDYGHYVKGELDRAGLDTSLIRTAEAKTSFSDVVSVRSTGERTFFHYEGANAEFGETDLLPVLKEGCDLLHVGYVMLLPQLDAADKEYGTALARLLKRAKERGIKTSIDCVSSTNGDFKKTVSPALRFCNSALLNEIESAM